MSKLYWRIKRNGKWTWTPAVMLQAMCTENYAMVKQLSDPKLQTNLQDFAPEPPETPPDNNRGRAEEKESKRIADLARLMLPSHLRNRSVE